MNPFHDPVIHGCKDVTDIVKRDVVNNEVRLNIGKAKGWHNLHFWPERAMWPPIPRKVAIKYSWGDGPVIDYESKAIPNELYSVIITRPNDGGNNDAAAAAQANNAPALRLVVQPVESPHNKIHPQQQESPIIILGADAIAVPHPSDSAAAVPVAVAVEMDMPGPPTMQVTL